MRQFIGRERELKRLNDLSERARAAMVVIKGRRRVGKSRLVEEFATGKVYLPFAGLAPIESVSAQDQRDAFARQFAAHFRLPPLTFTDWSDAFSHLSNNLPLDAPTVILFDEISWMGDKDPTFLPKLKVWWDDTLQKRSNILLILCGSVSIWIEENIIKSTAFFGRISLQISLGELNLSECAQLLSAIGFKGSLYDKFKLLAITGGVPWYIEQISPSDTADLTIKRLCFEKDGLLVGEFDKIFHDLFKKHGDVYKKIVHILDSGMRDLVQIRESLAYAKSGSLSGYMASLITSGFASYHYNWSFKTQSIGKKGLYRLSDNYLRFFLKYIEPNMPKIANNHYMDLTLSHLPGWQAMMGLQIENLILNNRALLLAALGLAPSDIVADNPYIQRTTTRHTGCQIDYLIQTHTNTLFVCEFKTTKRELGIEVIESVQEKIDRLAVPRGFAVVPVLVHLGEVSRAVYEKKYFYRIIDLADFL